LFRSEVSVKAGFHDREGDELEEDTRDIGVTTVQRAVNWAESV